MVMVPFPLLEVQLDATAVLKCEGDGDPLPDIQWLLLPAMTLLPSADLQKYVCD